MLFCYVFNIWRAILISKPKYSADVRCISVGNVYFLLYINALLYYKLIPSVNKLLWRYFAKGLVCNMSDKKNLFCFISDQWSKLFLSLVVYPMVFMYTQKVFIIVFLEYANLVLYSKSSHSGICSTCFYSNLIGKIYNYCLYKQTHFIIFYYRLHNLYLNNLRNYEAIFKCTLKFYNDLPLFSVQYTEKL